ncbi:MAG: discoidin domain-containing protein [Clostridia bacterium]|nr:discoidin domain-containing protein [Clostridia bacterium]
MFLTLIAAVLAVTLLTGCGGSPAGQTTGPQDGTTGADPATEPEATSDGITETEEAASSEEQTEAQAAYPKDKKLNVLLIGNSFTYYNDMNAPNGILKNVIASAGYDVSVSSVYHGSYYLHQFLDETDSLGKQALTKLKSRTKYDIVVIQDQSVNPIVNPGDFYRCCREFKKLTDENGGQLYLYATWGYKTGQTALSTYGTSTADMEAKLRAAYAAIGEELGVPVINAGAAFTLSFTENPRLDIYHTDLKHPSEAGSYLIAYTIFGTVFGEDPAELTYNGSLTESAGAALRSVASRIVREGAPVDEKYRTSSQGVEPIESQEAKPGVVDASKTVPLTSKPSSSVISVIKRTDTATGNGWMTAKSGGGTFSGIRGDRDAIASSEYSDKGLTAAQKADIADIGYGVSVIGIEYMDATKKGTNIETAAGQLTSVTNLVNGHWGLSYMAAMFFDSNYYDVSGNQSADAPYTGLITLNFGEKKNFDAIGYFSGSLDGFAQAQDVYVSDDGVNWTKVESASYDAAETPLASLTDTKIPDPWNNNTATVETLFSMSGASGKYIRLGIIRGGNVGGNATGLMEINTREIVVYGG